MTFVSTPMFSGSLNQIRPKPKSSDHCMICKLGPPLPKFHYLSKHNPLIWNDKQMIFVSIPRFWGSLNQIRPKPKSSDHCIICKLGLTLLKFHYLAITRLFEMINMRYLCLPHVFRVSVHNNLKTSGSKSNKSKALKFKYFRLWIGLKISLKNDYLIIIGLPSRRFQISCTKSMGFFISNFPLTMYITI